MKCFLCMPFCVHVCFFRAKYSNWNFFFVGGWRFSHLIDAIKLPFESVQQFTLPWACISIPAKTKVSDSFHFGQSDGCEWGVSCWFYFEFSSLSLRLNCFLYFKNIWFLSFFSCELPVDIFLSIFLFGYLLL